MKFLVLCRAVSDDEVTVGIPPVSPASLGTVCVLTEAKPGPEAFQAPKESRIPC